MTWEGGNQWLAGYFKTDCTYTSAFLNCIPQLYQSAHRWPNLVLSCWPTGAEKNPSVTWWQGAGRSSLQPERREEAGWGWRAPLGVFSHSICCILNAPHLYLSWRTRVLRPNRKKGNTGADFAQSWLPVSESLVEFIFWQINQRRRCTSGVSFCRVKRLLCLSLHPTLTLN